MLLFCHNFSIGWSKNRNGTKNQLPSFADTLNECDQGNSLGTQLIDPCNHKILVLRIIVGYAPGAVRSGSGNVGGIVNVIPDAADTHPIPRMLNAAVGATVSRRDKRNRSRCRFWSAEFWKYRNTDKSNRNHNHRSCFRWSKCMPPAPFLPPNPPMRFHCKKMNPRYSKGFPHRCQEGSLPPSRRWFP